MHFARVRYNSSDLFRVVKNTSPPCFEDDLPVIGEDLERIRRDVLGLRISRSFSRRTRTVESENNDLAVGIPPIRFHLFRISRSFIINKIIL
jgi:hypothetical protein